MKLASLHKADQHVIDFTQRTYDRVWDQTGIYAGTCTACCAIVDATQHKFDLISCVALLPVLIAALMQIQDQVSKNYSRHNQIVTATITLARPFRLILIGLTLFSVIIDWSHIFSALFALAIVYLFCVRFRDRQPLQENYNAQQQHA